MCVLGDTMPALTSVERRSANLPGSILASFLSPNCVPVPASRILSQRCARRPRARFWCNGNAAGASSFSLPFSDGRAARPGEVEELLSQMDNRDSSVRLRALLQCRFLSPEHAAPVICKMLDNNETDLQCRGFACLFLAYKPNPRSFDMLHNIVADVHEAQEVVANAVAALGYLKNSAAIPLCLRLLRNKDTYWSIRSSAAVSVGIIAEENPAVRCIVFDDLMEVLKAAITEDDVVMLQSCVGALAEVRDVRCVPYIVKYLKSDDFPVAQCVCEALAKLPCAQSRDALQGVIDDGDSHVNVLWSAEIAIKAVREALA